MKTILRKSLSDSLALILMGIITTALAPMCSLAQQPGAIDTSFTANLVSGADSSYIFHMALQRDGKILVAGRLRNAGNLTRLNPDGRFDSGFKLALKADSQIRTVAVQGDGKILVGGWFTSTLGEVTRTNFVRLQPDGSLDASLDPGLSADSWVKSLVVQPDGKILVGGSFKAFAGTPRKGVARINSDGQLDVDFKPLPWAVASVGSLALQSDGKVLIPGQFFDADNRPLPALARLHADGSVDDTFKYADGLVGFRSMALLPDGKVLIGFDYGFFASDGALVIRLNADGSRDPSFEAKVTRTGDLTFNGPAADAMAVQPNGKVLIGGTFSLVNQVRRRGLARLNPDGSLDSSFDPGSGTGPDVTWHYPTAFLLEPDGKVLVGGPFTTFNSKPCGGIVRVFGDPLPSLASPTFSQNEFRATLFSLPGQAFQIETSSDLGQWTSVTAVANPTGVVSFTHASPNLNQRFYRAVTK